MDKLIPNAPNAVEREKVDLQMDAFRLRQGLFGYTNARNTCKKRAPAGWWIAYGDEAPELRNFAVKILSLTCSSSGCERNWSTFSQIHTKRMNRLSASRLNSLAYIMYNKKLKDRHIKKKALTEEDPLVVENVPSDNEWIAGGNDENISGLTSRNDDMEEGERTHGNEKTVGGEETREITLGRQGTRGTSSKQGNQKRKRNTLPSKTMSKDKGKGLQLVDEEPEFEDLSTDNEEDDRAIRYDDDSMEDPLTDDSDDGDGGDDLEFDPLFKPLDTNDTLLT